MGDITRDDLRVNLGPYVYGQGDPCEPITDEEFDRLAREAGYTNPGDAIHYDVMDWLRDVAGPDRAEVLRALLTDECETCEGHGGLMHVHTVAVPDHAPGCNGVTCESTCPVPVPMPVEEWEPCPSCGGRGWLPKDGVTIKPESEWAVNGHFVIFPVDWLEAEDAD